MLCAHGNAYSTQWVGIGLAHTSNSHTFTIFIISHKDSYNKQYPLTNPHLDTHVVTYLNPNNYKYSPPNMFPNIFNKRWTQTYHDPMRTPIPVTLHYPHLR